MVSSLLRENNKADRTTIILDETIFPKSFINKVCDQKHWGHVYVIKKYPRPLHVFYRHLVYGLKYGELFGMKNVNLVFFTFGNDFTNLLINSIYEQNNVILGEDGLFPYYNFDILTEYYKALINEPFLRKMERFIMYKLNPKTRFNVQRINKLLLFNPEWLPPEVGREYEIERAAIDWETTQKVFEELSRLYDYQGGNGFRDIDVVYFDSDLSHTGITTERREFDLSRKILEQLRGMRIFIKLKPYADARINARRKEFYGALQEKTSCELVVENLESIYPWEILWYNNRHFLKDVILMSPSFSTAFITPKKFFGSENDIVCLKDIFLGGMPKLKSNSAIGELVERIGRTYVHKTIYTPETFTDIQDIVRSIGSKATHRHPDRGVPDVR